LGFLFSAPFIEPVPRARAARAKKIHQPSKDIDIDLELGTEKYT
jgi:hypothetical protein